MSAPAFDVEDRLLSVLEEGGGRPPDAVREAEKLARDKLLRLAGKLPDHDMSISERLMLEAKDSGGPRGADALQSIFRPDHAAMPSVPDGKDGLTPAGATAPPSPKRVGGAGTYARGAAAGAAGGAPGVLGPARRGSALREGLQSKCRLIKDLSGQYLAFASLVFACFLVQKASPALRVDGGSLLWWSMYAFQCRLLVSAARLLNYVLFDVLFELRFIAESVVGTTSKVLATIQGLPVQAACVAGLVWSTLGHGRHNWLGVESERGLVVAADFPGSDAFAVAVRCAAVFGACVAGREVIVQWATGQFFDADQLKHRLEEVTMSRKTLRKLSMAAQLSAAAEGATRPWDAPAASQRSASDATVEKRASSTLLYSLTSLTAPYQLGGLFGTASSLREVKRRARALFRALLPQADSDDGRLPVESVRCLIMRRISPERLGAYMPTIDVLFPRSSGPLSEDRFVLVLERAFKDMRYMAANLQSVSAVHEIVARLIRYAINVLIAVALLTAAGVNFFEATLPLLTLLVAASFAFGDFLTRIVTGVMFVAVSRPFEIGDNIVLKRLGTGYAVERPYIVERLDVMVTTLRSLHNEVFQIPNHVLANYFIVNHRRSRYAQLSFTLAVHYKTPQDKLDKLVDDIALFVAGSSCWRASLVTFTHLTTEHSALHLLIYLQHRQPWQELAVVVPSRDAFVRWLAAWLANNAVEYVRPVQPVGVVDVPSHDVRPPPGPPPARPVNAAAAGRSFFHGWAAAPAATSAAREERAPWHADTLSSGRAESGDSSSTLPP